jgi:MFS family permease
MTFAVLANTSVQLTAEPAIRGRVMAVYLTFFLGGGALGAPLLGLLSERFGPMRAIASAGALGLVAAAAGAVVLTAVRRRDKPVPTALPPVPAAVIPSPSRPVRNSPARIASIVYQRDTEAVDPRNI